MKGEYIVPTDLKILSTHIATIIVISSKVYFSSFLIFRNGAALFVSRAIYDRVETGSIVAVHLKGGLLHVPWFFITPFSPAH